MTPPNYRGHTGDPASETPAHLYYTSTEGAPRTQFKGSFMLGLFDFDPENIHGDSGGAGTQPPSYLEISIPKKGHIGHTQTNSR